jgi:predicted DsbA family dithiol-disulfide isomerase
MFDAAGLPHADSLPFVPNSRKALVLGELARQQGLLDEVHPRLFRAYWVEGRDIGADDVLLDIAAEAGMDRAEVIDRLAAPGDVLAAIEQETREVVGQGVTGVPGWVVDERFMIPGAQPHEVFERVLGGLGHEPRDDDGS